LSVSYLVARAAAKVTATWVSPDAARVSRPEFGLSPAASCSASGAAEKVSGIQVRFTPCGGLAGDRPGRGRGGYAPGVDGGGGEHLIAAAIGLGRFRERSFKLGATTFALLRVSIGAEDEGRTATRIEAARGISTISSARLGRSTRGPAAARADGDEIAGEGGPPGRVRPLSR